jgi:hypothetical protein
VFQDHVFNRFGDFVYDASFGRKFQGTWLQYVQEVFPLYTTTDLSTKIDEAGRFAVNPNAQWHDIAETNPRQIQVGAVTLWHTASLGNDQIVSEGVAIPEE